ncbi:MAG: GC-type dockerin domain-anchored protein [Phycisphaerales bacterium]
MRVQLWTCVVGVLGATRLASAQSAITPFDMQFVYWVSADGSAVAGRYGVAARWTLALGVQPLAFQGNGVAYCSSTDGAVIVGEHNKLPFRWTQATGMVLLPLPTGGVPVTPTGARGVSGDGTIVAGSTYMPSPISRAFGTIWTNGVPMMLTPQWPGNTELLGISRNGVAVIGTTGGRGFYWTAAGGFVQIPPMPEQQPGNPGRVAPYAINPDGTIIVGAREPAPLAGWVPFRWRVGQAVENLPKLPEYFHCVARGVSDDGRTIVGYGVDSSQPEDRAFIWKEGRGTMALTDYLAEVGVNVPAGTRLFNAYGLSASGLVIAGTGVINNLGPSYRVELPCPANCDGSTAPPVLNVTDFICFLNKYAAGNSSANCDASTTPPTLNIADFVCFQTQFAAGCA